MPKPSADGVETTPGNQVRAFWRWTVFGLAVVALLFQLGRRGLNEPDEGRYAEVGREMIASGDWLVPRWNGIEHLSKPPITYWLIAASLKLFGVNDFAARLPAALAALGTLVAVYRLARSAWGERAALWAVLVLLTSLEFFAVARLITPDMILTCLVTWSVWWFWDWYTSADKRPGPLVWFYGSLGLAMMTKGPIGVILPLFAVLAVRWRNPRLRLRQMKWGRGALFFLLIAAPWFVALAWRDPELWHYFIVREVFERVATGKLGRNKVWWYFLPVVMAGMWPWTPLLLTLRRWRESTAVQKDFVRLCAGWAALGLILFTLCNSKLPTYVLPLYAPLAMLLGAVVARVEDRETMPATRGIWLSGIALMVTQMLGVALAAGVAHARYALPWGAMGGLLGVTAAGTTIGAVLLWRGRRATAAVTFVVTTLVALLAIATVIPRLERSLGAQTTAKWFGERIRHEDPANDAPVVLYDTTVWGLPFYLGRPVRLYHFLMTDQEQDAVSKSQADAQTKSTALTKPQFRQLLAGPQRMFCVARASQVDRLQTIGGGKLYLLEQAGPWVLLSNQPAPS